MKFHPVDPDSRARFAASGVSMEDASDRPVHDTFASRIDGASARSVDGASAGSAEGASAGSIEGASVSSSAFVSDAREHAAELSDSELQERLDAAFARRRVLDASIARLAGEVAARSRASLGRDGLARRNGSSDAAAMVAQIGRISRSEASRLSRVGEATAPRRSLTGEVLPPTFELLATAFHAGRLPVDSVTHILTNLAQAAPRAEAAHLIRAEEALVEFASAGVADDVRKLSIRWRDALDVDGIEPREDLLVSLRSVKRLLLPNGMKRYVIDLDPLSAAYLDTAIDAEVTSALRKVRFVDTSSDRPVGAPRDDSPGNEDSRPDGDPRTIAQMAADVIVDLARHVLSCTDSTAPLAAATVVVRMTEEALRTGIGEACIDGGDQPISAGTARRLAAEGEIIPMVLGGDSEVLDLGRAQRLFTRAQRIAMAERDGGCAFTGCSKPPSHTEAHHIEWWVRDFGPSDLDNGVLLCTRDHHRVHQEGWDIRVDRGKVWFTPPSTIDVARRPRRGGRLPAPQLE